MIIDYISKDGNWEKTEDLVLVPDHLEKFDGVWFEKREEVKAVKKVEKVEEHKNNNSEEAMREFLKSKKIKATHLLKGQTLIDKAIANGFII